MHEISSHKVEAADTYSTDLAVALNTYQIRTGALQDQKELLGNNNSF